MKYILGSGLVAFIAKEIYPDYKILPIGKSRFFTYNVSTCDNYIYYNDISNEFLTSIKSNTTPILFKRAISYAGQLLFNLNTPFINNWIDKCYDGNPNPLVNKLIKEDGFIFNTTCTEIFKLLERKHKSDFREFIESQNKIVSIDPQERYILTKNGPLEYDDIISTVPLDYLYKICGIEYELESLDLHTYAVETDELDFEGASELLVADSEIAFHKCTRLNVNTYQFFSHTDIVDLRSYLSNMMKRFNILSGTCVPDATYLGDPKKFPDIDGIFRVCSSSWDDMMDISSCIIRLYNKDKKDQIINL